MLNGDWRDSLVLQKVSFIAVAMNSRDRYEIIGLQTIDSTRPALLSMNKKSLLNIGILIRFGIRL